VKDDANIPAYIPSDIPTEGTCYRQLQADCQRAETLAHELLQGRGGHCPAARTLSGADSRRLVIELLQPFPAEVDIKDFITGLWSFGMAPKPGATPLRCSQLRFSQLRCSQRNRAAEVLAHQGKSSAGDQREADQVNNSQEVVQGSNILSITLL
jgi:hypothetical protein